MSPKTLKTINHFRVLNPSYPPPSGSLAPLLSRAQGPLASLSVLPLYGWRHSSSRSPGLRWQASTAGAALFTGPTRWHASASSKPLPRAPLLARDKVPLARPHCWRHSFHGPKPAGKPQHPPFWGATPFTGFSRWHVPLSWRHSFHEFFTRWQASASVATSATTSCWRHSFHNAEAPWQASAFSLPLLPPHAGATLARVSLAGMSQPLPPLFPWSHRWHVAAPHFFLR